MVSFFSAENFRTKQLMVDNAVKWRLRGKPELDTWDGLIRRAAKRSITRNKLAHGAPWSIDYEGQKWLGWSGNIYDSRWILRAPLSDLRPPSIRLNEIEAFTKGCRELGQGLSAFVQHIPQLPTQK